MVHCTVGDRLTMNRSQDPGTAAGSSECPVELPATLQRELLELEARADQVTHYELLGITADADGAVLRRAYLEKSKRFHPDAWYRKELGRFGPLLSRWFQRLSAAYQILADEESRTAYDRDHGAELSDADRAAVQRRELSRESQERRQREGRERLLRVKGFARIGAARKLYQEALEHALAGERTSAIAALKAARELDPNRKEIGAKLLELEREQARARARSALASAEEREHKGLWAQAASAYASAFQNDAGSVAAALGAARCSLENGDAQAASTWASRTLELDPAHSEARFLLGRAFIAMNQKTRARAELTLLLDRHPDNKEARALLRGL